MSWLVNNLNSFNSGFDKSLDDDELFTAKLDYDYVRNGGCFRVFVATKRLLQTAIIFSNHVCSDGTYNLICQVFPVLM